MLPETKERSLQQQAEEYVFTKELRAGWYLDVRDTTNCWCLAEVRRITLDYVRVHYDGFQERLDEVNRANGQARTFAWLLRDWLL